MEKIGLSLVVPIFNELECLPELLDRSQKALSLTNCNWEILLVNDGSADECSEMLRKYAVADSRIKVVNLSRNFGHQAAITAGLLSASNGAVVIMDGDLQDPPELIPAFVAELERGVDVVIGTRASRKETLLRGWGFKAFHFLIKYIADYNIDNNSGVFGLMSQRAVAAFKRFGETNRFFPGLRNYIGFRTSYVSYERDARYSGEPKQSFTKLLRYGLDAIFSFSYKPLRLTLLLGIIVFFPASGYALLLFVQRILGIDVVRGFTTTAVAILVLGSIQLISIGIIGEYLGRVYDEVKKRPMYIIKDTLNL